MTAPLPSAQALLALAQRKRRHDLVRQQEFAQLRRIRNGELPVEQAAELSSLQQQFDPGAASEIGDLVSLAQPGRAPIQPPGLATVDAGDSLLEAAAMLFARGDALAAEASLRELLADPGRLSSQPPQVQARPHPETNQTTQTRETIWRTLLDLYRLTGQSQALLQTVRDAAQDLGYPLGRSASARSATHHNALHRLPGDPIELPAQLSLSGELRGDQSARLAGAESNWTEPVLVVDCSRLLRVDFEAASSMLNWAAALRARGQTVRWQQVHRLLAVLMEALGMRQVAQVVLRPD